MKYTLTAEDEFGGSTTTREFQVDFLPDVLSEIELFLKGAGFVFDGNLDFVNDFDTEQEYDTPHVGEMYDSTMNLPTNNWPFASPHHEWTQTLREDAAAEGQYYSTIKGTHNGNAT